MEEREEDRYSSSPTSWDDGEEKEREYMCREQRRGLTKEDAGSLLKRRGYEVTYVVEHVHATDGARQWHLCRCDELPAMEPEELMTRLDEALAFHAFGERQ